MGLTRLNCGDMPYYLEVNEQELEALRGLRVVLQLPDGLKQFSEAIAECLEASYGFEVIIHADSIYGACDIAYPQINLSIRPAAIVHLGHTPYPEALAYPPYSSPRGGVKVIYVPVRYAQQIPEGAIESAASLLRSRGASRVAVVVTAQHTNVYRDVVEKLRFRGFEVLESSRYLPYFEEGQVIGCDYRVVPRGADAYVMVSGGLFHAIGLYLATLKPVVQLDPYRGNARDLTAEGERFYRIRLEKINQASEAVRWGIIVGLRTGQYRPWLVEKLEAAMRRKSRRYRLIAAETVSTYTLRNVDSPWFQAFTVTACPRIPIDDLYEYEKPVLTPGEALMALSGSLERYQFPW